MLKLSDYIGQVLTDIATGREIADRNSAALSERYQADGFMKGMPVPHYTIDQASFDLPFMVVGVVTKGAMDEGIVEEIITITKERTIALINCFALEKAHQEKSYAEGKTSLKTEAPDRKFKEAVVKIADALVKQARISIEQEGLKILKLLDLVDRLCEDLGNLLEKKFGEKKDAKEDAGDDMGGMGEEGKDQGRNASLFSDPEDIKRICERYRRVLFNEYKDLISTTNGVVVDASTGKLNEYAEDNCLTHLKVTLREQDLDFIVEKDEKSGATKRFLSLN
jgi:hypothetical protein